MSGTVCAHVPDARVARLKRVLELYQADPAYRRLVREDAASAVRLQGLPGEDGGDIREAVEAIVFGTTDAAADNPYASAYLARVRLVIDAALALTGGERYGSEAALASVERSLSRARMESAVVRMHSQIRYVPLAFELSEGCRMRCPFCGLAALPWTRDAAYVRDEWRALLTAARSQLGPVADQAPLYFATEPLDHPAYEDFLRDVGEVFDHIPQTTTAAPEREVGRTRRLMGWLGSERLLAEGRLRFSIRTLAQLRRVHAAFTAEELAGVELLVNNPESINPISDSGRAREAYGQRRHVRYSISCLSGVLVRLWEGTLTYVEPVTPSDAFPLGIRAHETLPFETYIDFAEGLGRLFAAYDARSPDPDRALRLSPEVTLTGTGGQLVLAGDGVGYGMPRNVYTEKLARMLASDARGATLDSIEHTVARDGSAADGVRQLVRTLYQKGYLEYA